MVIIALIPAASSIEGFVKQAVKIRLVTKVIRIKYLTFDIDLIKFISHYIE